MSNDSISDALRQVAMVADVSSSALGLTRTDRQASRKSEQDHAAKDGASTVRVNRFAGADEKIKAIMDLQKEASANLRRNSMQWGNSKRRLLPNANFQRFIEGHTSIDDRFKLAVKSLVDDADLIIAEAKKNIGTFNVDLPTKEEMANAFSLSYELEPIPDGRQFGQFTGDEADLTGKVSEQLRYQFEENMRASYNSAMLDTAQRLAKPLENLAERMEAYDRREKDLANGKDPGREGYFRDTILENVQQIADVFGNMNVLGDARMDAIAKKLSAFSKLDAEILRKRGDFRVAVAARAKDILKDLDGILVR
jgi:hypothetical protein